MFTLNIKLNPDLDKNIKKYYTDYKSSKYEGDSGFDLPTPDTLKICKNGMGTINFGISCSMTDIKNKTDVSYYLYPRSSISSSEVLLANSVGIIDKGYRGNIMAKIRYIPIITNWFWEWLWFWWPNKKTIKKENKLFQICAPNLAPFKINIVDSLDETERGSNGFGSTSEPF